MSKLLVGVTFAVVFASSSVGALADEREKVDRLAREAAEACVKSLLARDLAGVMKVVDTPWCHDAKEIIKDREKLEQKFIENFGRSEDLSGFKLHIREVATLEQLRLKKSGPPARQVSLGEVLGKDDRVVFLELVKDNKAQPMWIGVRLDKGTAKVVGFVD